jgi:hypothetical protein
MTIGTNSEDRRYTVAQAAAVTGMSPSWIYEKAFSGELEKDTPAYKGERLRIRRSALEKMGKTIDESRLAGPTVEEMKNLEEELNKVRDTLQTQLRRNEDLHQRLVLLEDEKSVLSFELARTRGEDPPPPRIADPSRLRQEYIDLVGEVRAEPRRVNHDQ